MNQPVYLDYAAATPLDDEVLQAMQPYLTLKFHNPSALYLAARDVSRDLNDARARIARCIGARPSEVVFTAGATEANNLAIHGIMTQYPESNVVVSAIEHESVLAPAKQYAFREVSVAESGLINMDTLKEAIDDNTVLLSIMYANNEIGVVQSIKPIAALVQKIREARRENGNMTPLYLHTDAAQAANYLDMHVARLGVDMMTVNGSKIYGPKQTGFLYVRAGIILTPLIYGGGQEWGLRSGTENVPGIIGLARALEMAQQLRAKETERLQALQKQAFGLLEVAIPGVIINGSRKQRLPNNIHITIPGQDNERLIMELDEAGFQCAAGSACSASKDEPSHVLAALGVNDTDAQASLRVTLGRQTTEAHITRFVHALGRLVSEK